MVDLADDGTVGDEAEVTADFRDQYYGLLGAVVDEDAPDPDAGPSRPPTGPPLVTSGAIDPARLLWGSRTVRFGGASFRRPRVDLSRLDPTLAAWAGRRLVPKVLVATQTRVLEAVADPVGALLPSVPVVTVAAPSDRVHHLGALVIAPPVVALATLRHAGTGLGGGSLRLAARDVAALPRPAGRAAWDAGAAAFRAAQEAVDPDESRAHLLACGAAMCTAFGVADPEPLLAWWTRRLPPVRG